MRTIYWFITFWFHLLAMLRYVPKVNRFPEDRLEEKRRFIHAIAQKWAQGCVKRTGTQVKVIGLEHVPKEGPVLFVGNHQGNFDIPIALGYLPKPLGFISKIELQKLPLVNRWMERLECVFLDRKDLRQSLRAMNQAAEILKSGHSMVIFPEGTRSKGPKMGEFKPGSLKIAIKAGVPIVPFTINGSYQIMEANGNRIRPAEVSLIISPPIEAITGDKTMDLTATVYEAVEKHLAS